MQNKVRIADDWYALLEKEFEKDYFQQLGSFVRSEYLQQQVFPPAKQIFRAFDACPVNSIKVVILGQDPYHGLGQANGLSFSVGPHVKFPPSLVNILKEVEACGYSQKGCSGDLERWSRQGVLLLNAVLTVRAHQAASHAKQGWERFTDAVIHLLNQEKKGIVYMLWGAYAQAKANFVNPQTNLILRSVHPSPLAAHRGFFGNKHFCKANEYLSSPIHW